MPKPICAWLRAETPAKGELKKAQATARKALLKNMPLSDIAEFTGLSEAEIEALRRG